MNKCNIPNSYNKSCFRDALFLILDILKLNERIKIQEKQFRQ